MSLFRFYKHRVDCLHIQKSILAQFYLISIANLKVISWSRSSKPAACGKLITILVSCILKQNYLILKSELKGNLLGAGCQNLQQSFKNL